MLFGRERKKKTLIPACTVQCKFAQPGDETGGFSKESDFIKDLNGTLHNEDDDKAVNDNEKYEFAFMGSFPIIPTRSACKMCSNWRGN